MIKSLLSFGQVITEIEDHQHGPLLSHSFRTGSHVSGRLLTSTWRKP